MNHLTLTVYVVLKGYPKVLVVNINISHLFPISTTTQCVLDNSELFNIWSLFFPKEMAFSSKLPSYRSDKSSLWRGLSSVSERKIKWSVWVSGFWRKIWSCGWLNEQSRRRSGWGEDLSWRFREMWDARMLNKFWGSRTVHPQSLVTESEGQTHEFV